MPLLLRLRDEPRSNSKDSWNLLTSKAQITMVKSKRRDTKTEMTSLKKEYKCPLCPKVLLSVNFLNLHYKKLHLGQEAIPFLLFFLRGYIYRTLKYANILNEFSGITSAKDKSRKVLKKNQKKCSTSNTRGKRERKYQYKCLESNCPQHFPSEYFRDAHHKRKHLGKFCSR